MDPGVRSSAQGSAVDGPPETTEAPRLPTTKLSGGPKTAGQNGFGDFCRNKSHPPHGVGTPLIYRRHRRLQKQKRRCQFLQRPLLEIL